MSELTHEDKLLRETIDPSTIEVASFDVWMTLIKSNPNHKVAQAQLIAKRWGIAEEGFVDIMKAEDRAVDAESDQNGIQYGPVERLSRIANRIDVHVTEENLSALAEEVQTLAGQYLPVLLEDNIPESLARIKEAGIEIAILSNTGFINAVRMRKNLGSIGVMEHVDYPVFSNEVGIAKPDKRIYAHVGLAAGVRPETIIHIGDNYLADYQGARSAGLQAIHIARNGESEAEINLPSIEDVADILTGAK
jgi:putative hydrolase of the HAD superfamily